MKKRLFWIIPLIIVVLAAIIYPWQKIYFENKKNSQQQEEYQQQQEEYQTIAGSFAGWYGAQARISNIATPKIIRAVYWTDDKYMHASLYIDGVWFEYAREEIPSAAPTPAPSSNPSR
jgi:hypothetical protein